MHHNVFCLTHFLGAPCAALGLWHFGLWRRKSPHRLGLQARGVKCWFVHRNKQWYQVQFLLTPFNCSHFGFIAKRHGEKENDLCGWREGMCGKPEFVMIGLAASPPFCSTNSIELLRNYREMREIQQNIFMGYCSAMTKHKFSEHPRENRPRVLNPDLAFEMVTCAGFLLKPSAAKPFYTQRCCRRSQKGRELTFRLLTTPTF